MKTIEYYANQYNKSKQNLREIYLGVADKIIKNNNHQDKINAVKHLDQITICDKKTGMPLISTDIPFGFIENGERIFTENFTYNMTKALDLITQGFQF